MIVSVNEEPDFLVKSNRLRKDLYYRLNVIRINIPELNSRKEDIPLLITTFIEKLNYKLGTAVKGITDEALDVLMKKDYEGNVRELEHIIEGALNYKVEGIIEVENLGLENKKENTSLRSKMQMMKVQYIKEALLIFNYNVSKVSKFWDMPRQTLQYKICKYKLNGLYKNKD